MSICILSVVSPALTRMRLVPVRCARFSFRSNFSFPKSHDMHAGKIHPGRELPFPRPLSPAHAHEEKYGWLERLRLLARIEVTAGRRNGKIRIKYNNDSEDTAVKVQCEWLNKKISMDNDSLQKF